MNMRSAQAAPIRRVVAGVVALTLAIAVAASPALAQPQVQPPQVQAPQVQAPQVQAPQVQSPQVPAQQPGPSDQYSGHELAAAGSAFFGTASGAIAMALESVFARYGMPNGYILGQEGGAAIIGGLTYGEGVLYTKNAGDHYLFWQGPSIGYDFGAEGARTMMLVYNLPSVDQLYGRYGGVAGSAYLVAGLGVNVLKRNDMLLVPVRTGVGARFGASVGYLKLTARPTWNPF